MIQRINGNPPWMETANDKNFSDARWQAQGPTLLEPAIATISTKDGAMRLWQIIGTVILI